MVETDAFTELRLPVCKRTGRRASDDRNARQQSAHKMPHGLGRTGVHIFVRIQRCLSGRRQRMGSANSAEATGDSVL